MSRTLATRVALAAGCLLTQAHAAEAPPADLATMQKRLDQLESLVSQLRTELDAERAARQKVESTAVIRPVTDGKSLKLQSPSGDFAFQVGGRVEADFAHYDADRQKLGDGTDIRRGRLYAQGTMYRDWDWKFEYEFADNATTSTNSKGITDAYLRYKGFAPLLITAGNFKQPFGLEQMMSAHNLTFTERALSQAFVPGRGIGLGVQTAGAHWSLAGAVAGERPEGDVSNEGDEGWNLTARGTYAPFIAPGRVLHFGAGVWRLDPNDSTAALRWRSKPESNVTGVFLVDTGTLTAVDDVLAGGLELAAVWGPLSLQAEYMRADVNRGSARDARFDGGYVQASWFLTGESRPYKVADGIFDRVMPNASVGLGGIGAWEIAARLSTIDLTDGGIVGGQQDDLTLALNWYLAPNLRLMLDYVRVLKLDRPGNLADSDEPNSLTGRLHFDF
jgi:phosphate-selective porin OprO/OprP